MSLRDYDRKRDFDATPEPSGALKRTKRGRHRQPIFVVQLHHARARHYDFRLEVDGALKSWAVPKGPSLRAGEKRLAVEVEDHPLAYATFAGDIPEGHYGAGHVDVFDHGWWSPEADPLKALAKGHLDFELHGGKLRGRWTLVRTRLAGSKQQWLLMKRNDEEVRDLEADDLIGAARPPASSRRAPRKKDAPRAADATPPRAAPRRTTPERSPTTSHTGRWRERALALDGARARALPAGFKPQLCTLQAQPPNGEDWLHETKWDGYRLLVDLDRGKARLRSRNDLDWTARFTALAAAIEALPVAGARLDGELIAVDRQGGSDFSALQRALEAGTHASLRYVVFDLPALEGVDLSAVALAARKDLLQSLLGTSRSALLSFSTHIAGHGDRVFEAARRRGLEGIVSKRADAAYVQGRSHTWVKVKHANTDEFVVVGYTAPKGAREGFGALLLAAVDRGALRYVGRVGSGFDDALLRSLSRRLGSLGRTDAVLALPAHVPFRASAVHWVSPELVAEVEFRGWGKEGLLRQASFLRLREDKTREDLGMPARKTSSLPARAPSKRVATGVTITHPDRRVFPGTRITKQAVADYYRGVADWLLPELIERPLSVVRCPEGAGGTCFFQKHHAASLGGNVAAIALKEKGGGTDDYLYVKDLRGVLELVQMNVLEFHPWGARIATPDRPDRLVFDLDPGPGVDWKAVVAAARDVRARLGDAGLESFVRLSGGKGAHVVVPLSGDAGWEEAKAFCEAFARAMATQQPLRYLATASKAKRDGRLFIDWLRNARGATSVASWSLRAREGAPVAVPLRWEELGRTRAGNQFDLTAALRRAKGLRKEPWEGFASVRQSLPNLG